MWTRIYRPRRHVDRPAKGKVANGQTRCHLDKVTERRLRRERLWQRPPYWI